MRHRIIAGVRYFAVACFCVLGFAAIVATGGGGGGGNRNSSPPPPADAVGLWEGTLTSGDGSVYDVSAVVAPSGEMRMIDWIFGCQYVAHISVTGNTGTGNFTGYAPEGVIFANGKPLTNGSITCTIVEKISITGDYTAENDTGTFSLDYNPALERPLDFPNEVVGQWGYNISPNDWVDITINPDGSFTGTDSAGCQYSGAIDVIEPSWDILDITLSATQCGALNGSYSGLGIIEFDPARDMLWLMVSNPSFSYFDVILRQ